MDDEERREALEDAGLDPDDFNFDYKHLQIQKELHVRSSFFVSNP